MKKFALILLCVLILALCIFVYMRYFNNSNQSNYESNIVSETNDEASIEEGTDANAFMASADWFGGIYELTDRSFVVADPTDSSGNTVPGAMPISYDEETVLQTAKIKADGSFYSVKNGSLSDLTEGVFAMLYVNQNGNQQSAVKIIIVEFDYS